ncbi:hypothetical protein K491DRAFT_135848 [Lophiostoma macrostomum CBS 122681]|uniref:Uncharacterized protein n=1 Tax=Lophiostoma macrostomum CBS 122681 TaxID=1314788 RepID=A0A6A6TIF7_9PLEO|nr:hypothetical protein K491DRAFT_135848 [Lophiostoma macrostomum CBS 122681]
MRVAPMGCNAVSPVRCGPGMLRCMSLLRLHSPAAAAAAAAVVDGNPLGISCTISTSPPPDAHPHSLSPACGRNCYCTCTISDLLAACRNPVLSIMACRSLPVAGVRRRSGGDGAVCSKTALPVARLRATLHLPLGRSQSPRHED